MIKYLKNFFNKLGVKKVMYSDLPLYDHQQQALEALSNFIKDKANSVGRIIIPTGGGKTRIEAEFIKRHAIEVDENIGVSLVLFHRIALGQQHAGLGSIYDENKALGFREWLGFKGWSAAAFHSGDHFAPKNIPGGKRREKQTTNFNELKNHIEKEKRLGRYVIVFGTYQSFHKLASLKFDAIIADESQELVNSDYNKTFSRIDAKYKFCFTATEKWSESNDGFGLNNEKIFGPRVYTISPKELIDRGLIVPPKIHSPQIISQEEDAKFISDLCTRIASYHKKEFESTLGFSKTLFVAKSEYLLAVKNNVKSLREKLPDYDVCIFHTNKQLGYSLNGCPLKRNLLIEHIKSNKKCLVFHEDILSEGIDIPSFTGIAILKNLKHNKALQNIGRTLRLYKKNGKNIKTHSLVTVPVWSGFKDSYENIASYVIALREGGFPDPLRDISWELVEDAKQKFSLSEEEDLEDIVSLEEQKKLTQKKIHDILHLKEDSYANNYLPDLLKEQGSDFKVDIFQKMFNYIESKGV